MLIKLLLIGIGLSLCSAGIRACLKKPKSERDDEGPSE